MSGCGSDANESEENAPEEKAEEPISEQTPAEAPPADVAEPEDAQPKPDASTQSVQSAAAKAPVGQEEEQKPAVVEKSEEELSEKKQSTTSVAVEESKRPSTQSTSKVTHEASKRASTQSGSKVEDGQRTSTSEKDQQDPAEKGRRSTGGHDKAKASIGKSHGKSSESLEKRGTSQSATKDDVRKSRSSRLGTKAKTVLGSTISIRRLSATGELYDKTKGARFMNTYKLDSENPFNPDKVKKILESVMIEALENLTYDPDKCPKQAKWASSAIRAKVKELQFDRYKLICLVTIGEKNSQDILVTCRFLWDVDRDRYATYSIENSCVFGVAQCFGVYYE